MPKNTKPNSPNKKSSSAKHPTQGPDLSASRATPKPPKPDIVIEQNDSTTKTGSGHLKKRAVIIGTLLSIALIVLATSAWWLIFRNDKPVKIQRQRTKAKQEVVKPKTMPSPLTGVEVAPELAQKPVVAVMIENLYPSARPQSGLSSAGVVYEALAEGGITRYEAFFGDSYPDELGPIRSLRTHYLRWGIEYDAPVVHAGGSADSLDLIVPRGMKNLDQFYNGSYFKRVTSRYAPHNLYTTGPLLEKLVAARGFNTAPSFTPWPRKADSKLSVPTASAITIDPSYIDYRVSYVYDAATNSYARSVRNVPDVDAANSTPIKPKVVIVLKASTTYGPNRVGKQTTYIQTIGSGSGYVFQDGGAQAITWRKTSDKARTELLDGTGQPIKLNKGQSWITVIPLEKTVSYN